MPDLTHRFAADHGQPDNHEEIKGSFLMDWIAEGLSPCEAEAKWEEREAQRRFRSFPCNRFSGWVKDASDGVPF